MAVLTQRVGPPGYQQGTALPCLSAGCVAAENRRMSDFFTIPVKLRSLSAGQYHAWLSQMANSQRYGTQGRARQHSCHLYPPGTGTPSAFPPSVAPPHPCGATHAPPRPAPRTSTLVVAEGMTKIMAAVEADGVAVQRDALQHLHAGKPGHGWMQLAGCSGYYSVTGTWAGTGCLLARTYHSADGDWASTRNVARRHESFFLGELHRNQWETL